MLEETGKEVLGVQRDGLAALGAEGDFAVLKRPTVIPPPVTMQCT